MHTVRKVSQEADQVVWYSHLFQNFPQLIVIHTVKGFGIVNKAEIDVFLELLLFRWSSGCWQFDLWFLCLLKPAWTSRSSRFMYCWSLAWRVLSITLLACAAAAAVTSVVSYSVRPHRRHVRWVQLCGCLSSLWHCLSLGLEWKLTSASPVATAEFSKFAGILSATLSQHHLSGFEIAQLEFHHLH